MLSMFRGANKRTKTIWWVLTIVVVVTFVGGFVVLFGLGADRNSGGTASVLGSVNGQPISQADYQTVVNDQREAFRRQYGSEPADRDAKMVEMQAWRAVITQKLMTQLAQEEGMKVNDREVVLTLQTSPPTALASAPDFQTNGKFDAAKYQQALANPNINWSPFEQLVRSQLPTRKIEERLLASLKLSQPELRETYLDRNEHLNGVVVAVGPDAGVKVSPPGAADLDRIYQEYKSRFTSGTRVQLEVLQVPVKYTDEDRRSIEQLAKSLVDRARKGEDFGQLAKDYSEGPGAQQGGVVNRLVQPSEFGEFGAHLAALPVGGISDPLPGSGRYLIFKILRQLPDPVAATPSLQVAQIVLKLRSSSETLRQQYQDLVQIRDRATRIGLGKAATEKGLATQKTRPYDLASTPDELFGTPEAADWGLSAKKGAVSPVFQGVEEFLIAQVSERHEGGTAAKDEVAEPLRQIAEMEQRVTAAKPKADQIAAALAQGQTLEQAAQAAGLTAMPVQNVTRAAPDARIANSPEVVGALFAAAPGRVVGPVRTLGGWYFGRVDERGAPPDSVFEKSRGQISTEVLQRKQQTFFAGFVNRLREKAKIKDLRSGSATQ